MMTQLKQRGAMFGLDARITLIIAMVIALAVGVNQLSRINGDKADDTMARMERIKDATLAYANSFGQIPYWDFFNELTGASTNLYDRPFLANSEDTVDAWGNSYVFLNAVCNAEVSYYGVVLISAGANGVFDDPLGAFDYVEYDGSCDDFIVLDENDPTRVGEDDIVLRFNTYEVAQKQSVDDAAKLKAIMTKLEAQAARNRIRWQRTCEASGTGQTGCDYDADGTYYKGEELNMNFYPYATEVVGGCAASRPFYGDNNEFSRAYTSNNLASMQSLMTMLGLPTSYAASSGGWTLNYDSNDGNRCSAPFTAKVWYQ